jgi:integrase
MSYLYRREGRYIYRRRFPKDVADVVGRIEFRQALGTTDRQEALRLARQVSVEFDRLCSQAMEGLQGVSGSTIQLEAVPSQLVTPEAILDRLQGFVGQVVRGAVAALDPAHRITPTWAKEMEWRKEALRGIAAGDHPAAVQYNPLEARAALRAIEALERGEVPIMEQGQIDALGAQPEVLGKPQSSRVTAKQFAKALDVYCSRVSAGRGAIMRKLTSQVLLWPSTQAEQVGRILAFAKTKLEAGNKVSSVHTQAAGMITVLREIPGWEDVKLPRNDPTARTVRAGGQLQADARDAMPTALVRKVLSGLDARGDNVDAAAARLLVRYGLRPIELLQEGLDALGEREDVMGGKELVFYAGKSGAKNNASRRCLPVHADDIALFRLVLAARGEASEVRVRARIKRLSSACTRLLRGESGKLSLYSLRHTCADLLRAAGATPDEVGGVLGHTSSGSKATAVYGGKAPLGRPRELLSTVRELLDRIGSAASAA